LEIEGIRPEDLMGLLQGRLCELWPVRADAQIRDQWRGGQPTNQGLPGK